MLSCRFYEMIVTLHEHLMKANANLPLYQQSYQILLSCAFVQMSCFSEEGVVVCSSIVPGTTTKYITIRRKDVTY
jgi:hypothetical protein